VTDSPVSSEGARADGARAADAVEALSDAVGAIAGVLDLEAVLQLIVDRARTLVPARYAALGIVNERGRIEQFITSGISDEQRVRLGDPPQGHGLLGLIITEGRSFRIPEISAHPASYGFPPHHPPMHSLLGVPVRLKGRAIGNFYLTDKVHAPEFDDDDQRLVELFAQHAAIAIENARLHAAVGRLAVVEERERIGRDLHDGIIQSLYALGLSLEDVPDLMPDDPAEASARIDRAIDGLNATIGDLRGFIVGLRPDPLAALGLPELLAGIVEQFRRNTTADVEVAIADDVPDLPDDRRSEVAHIAREALSNVSRHAAAGRVEVRLERAGAAVVLTVADNGRGFDPGAAAPSGHYGLANMRERAIALGGRLDVESRPGEGTTVMMTVPVNRPTTPLEHTA
jgi:signal transduction histidine kinase